MGSLAQTFIPAPLGREKDFTALIAAGGPSFVDVSVLGRTGKSVATPEPLNRKKEKRKNLPIRKKSNAYLLENSLIAQFSNTPLALFPSLGNPAHAEPSKLEPIPPPYEFPYS